MKSLLFVILPLAILCLVCVNSLGQVLCQISVDHLNLERTFAFDVQYRQFRRTHKLYVSMPKSLYNYYKIQSHLAITYDDFARYATPSVFKSIAENIQKVTNSTPYPEEQFANAVLSLVRGIDYDESSIKYPIETIVENSGDCDALSLLAASIMKAGGLDIVLLLYEGTDIPHMNVGVYLPYEPVYRIWWSPAAGFEFKDKKYWVAECTSLGEWKVGDTSETLLDTNTSVIPFSETFPTSPDEVSSSLDTQLLTSAISIEMSPNNLRFADNDLELAIYGGISPPLPNKTVTMYITQNKHIRAIKTTTDETGNYEYKWNFTTTSTYQIQTSCTEILNHTAAESGIITLFSPHNEVEKILKRDVSGNEIMLSGELMLISSNQTEIESKRENAVLDLATKSEEKSAPDVSIGQLSFVMQQDEMNDSSTIVMMLEDQEAFQKTNENNEISKPIINPPKITEENTWYNFEAIISKDANNVTLREGNGNKLYQVSQNSSDKLNEIRIAIAQNPSSVIVIRNLRIEPFDHPIELDIASQGSKTITRQPSIHIGLIVVIFTIAGAINLSKKKIK